MESIKEYLTTLTLLDLNELIKKLQVPVITPTKIVKKFVLPLLGETKLQKYLKNIPLIHSWLFSNEYDFSQFGHITSLQIHHAVYSIFFYLYTFSLGNLI